MNRTLGLSPTLAIVSALFHKFTRTNDTQMETHDLAKMPFV